MSLDIDLSGYVFTHEEWMLLDEDFRTELLDAAQSTSRAARDDAEASDR